MKIVFLVRHTHELSEDVDDEKLIGVYETREDADAAIRRVSSQPGFRHFPDGFSVEEYEIGKDHWTEGFVTAVLSDGTIRYENQ